MTCNLGTEKMPIILDQPETDSSSANQQVYHTMEMPQDHNGQNYGTPKSYKIIDIEMDETLKDGLVKNCLSTKKITDEELKKYSQNIVTSHYMYSTNELLDMSNAETHQLQHHQQSDSLDSSKIECRKLKKKIKPRESISQDFPSILSDPHILDVHGGHTVESIFENKGDKDKCELRKKGKVGGKLGVMKKCYKLITPHPSSCESQEEVTVEKSIQKVTAYAMNSRTESNEAMKEFEEQHMKESEVTEKLQEYTSYSFSEKRQGELYIQSNLLSEFESFGKESKVNDDEDDDDDDDEDDDDIDDDVGVDLKSKDNFETRVKCYKCFNCPYMSLSVDSLNYHSQKKDKCFNNNETFHCPGCKNVFYSLTPLRVHLVHDHKMSQREVKLILHSIRGETYNKLNCAREKPSCVYESAGQMLSNGGLFGESMTATDMAAMDNIGERDVGVDKGGSFVQLSSSGRSLTDGRGLEPCLNSGKRQTMLESYLDDISNKGDCSLPPALTQNGSDLLENTFNFTAPVSEQLPSIQPPPAHSSSNGLMEHTHLMMNPQGNHGYVGIANVFPEHRVEETFKTNEGNQYDGGAGLMLSNGNYGIHDIPVINLDDNHLGKPTSNILPQDINMDDFPPYHENGLPSLEEDGCRLSIEDDDQEEKKKLKKLGVGYRCDINGCKVRLQSEKNIQYHRRCHEGLVYNCPECCKDCSTWVSLSSHLWQAHKIDMELYKCDQCPYKTPSYSRLTNIHRGIHGKARPFLCDVCGKGFKTVKQMRNHKNIHKAKMVRMSVCHCEICGRTVADKRQLELHINNTHKKKKPYLCYICGYASAAKHSLVVHMRRHTGEKPYECEKCEYKTADHNALRRHKMKHTGVRNYKCNRCSYTCIQASTYKVHIKTKHPELETDVIFGCGQCSFQTLNRGSFLSHTSEHENYNGEIRKQANNNVRCHTTKQGAEQPQTTTTTTTQQEYFGESNRIDLVGPIISERVVETIRDLSGAQTLLEDDYYERITGDLEASHELKYKTSGIT